MMDKSSCLNAKYSSTAGNHKNEHSGVAIPVKVSLDGIRKISWGGGCALIADTLTESGNKELME